MKLCVIEDGSMCLGSNLCLWSVYSNSLVCKNTIYFNKMYTNTYHHLFLTYSFNEIKLRLCILGTICHNSYSLKYWYEGMRRERGKRLCILCKLPRWLWLWRTVEQILKIWEVFVPNRRDKWGYWYGFVPFLNVNNAKEL